MPVFLSPGVFPREIDLSLVPAAVGALTPAFIGTAKKGPVQKPTFVSNSQQYIDTFGSPFPESFLGYAVLAYFEEGNRAWILRVGVECAEGQPEQLSSICIDTSGSRGKGWGRIAIFTGIDFGRICTRIISAAAPISIHDALASDITYNEINVGPTFGPASATLSFINPSAYSGPIDDAFTLLLTSDVPTPGSVMDGATFQVIRNSDGSIVLSDTIVESGTPGTSENIDAGDGLVFKIIVTGSTPLQNNDTFTWIVRPDNRKFSFNVDRQDSMTVVEFTLPNGSTYTTADAFAAAINSLIGAGQPYGAIAKDDDTVCFTSDIAGQNIQIVSTEAFSLEVGQTLYAFDIPRSYLVSTNSGPYNITSENNRVSINDIGISTTNTINFSMPVGLNLTPSSVAASIHLGGVSAGTRYWRSYSMLVPSGDEQVFIETVEENQFDQLQILADLAHFKTLRFAEELDIQFPYTRA